MVGKSEDPQLQAPVKHALTGTPQSLPLIPVLFLIMLPILMCPLLFPGDSLALSTATLTWDPNMESDLAGYNVYVGTSPGIYGAPITVGSVTLYTVSGLLEGVTYFFAVTAYDTSGNESIPSKEISKTIPLPSDTTPPTVSLTAPTAGATVTGTITLQASATDNVSVSGVQFLVNAANLGAEVLTVPYSMAWNTGSLSPGTYTLTAVARDAAGNHTTSAPVIVQVAEPPSGTGFLQDAGPDGLLVLEAEHFQSQTEQNGHTWAVVQPTGYAGDGAMQAAPNTNTLHDTNYVAQSPRLDYPVTFTKTGLHYVWVRGLGASGGDDSVHVGLDGQAIATSDRIEGFTGVFGWSNATRDSVVATITVTSPGAHTLNVWMREDGFVVDKVLLTTTSTYTPTGLGPAESPQAQSEPPSGTGFLQDSTSDGLLSIEAEHFDGNTPQGIHAWNLVTATGQAGIGAMQCTPNQGINQDIDYVAQSPRLDYSVTFTKTGLHYVWVRGLGASGGDDSVHVGLDGQAIATSDRIEGFTGVFGWSNATRDSVVATITVTSPGAHTLNVWMREDGFVVDKVLLTTNATYTPSGMGPAESLQVK